MVTPSVIDQEVLFYVKSFKFLKSEEKKNKNFAYNFFLSIFLGSPPK